MSVLFINCFEVPNGRDDEFFALWREVNSYMVAKPGYLGHRLHRAAGEARFRYVNYASWESADAWKAAHDEGFRALLSKPAWKDFPPLFALYDIAHENGRI